MRKIDWDESGPLENWQRAVLTFARRAREEMGEHVVHIILYGSRARGDYTEDSDIDVLVVVRGVDAKEADERLSWLAWEVLEDYDELFSVRVVLEDEYAVKQGWSYYVNVNEDGVTV